MSTAPIDPLTRQSTPGHPPDAVPAPDPSSDPASGEYAIVEPALRPNPGTLGRIGPANLIPTAPSSPAPSPSGGYSPRASHQKLVAPHRRSDRLWDRIEAFISALSVRDNFWSSICSFIWLPLAFFSGIKMKKLESDTFEAILPFRKFNRNWYNAMAGGALLANSEIAGGMYVFGVVGADYTVVCRQLEYKFLRPCVGPAVYRVTPKEDIKALVAAGTEFNITCEMDISQQTFRKQDKDRRVGKCVATFHVTPKAQHKARKLRGKSRP
jgi:acyl-coenzyme A thioesterase PaaI-like protein